VCQNALQALARNELLALCSSRSSSSSENTRSPSSRFLKSGGRSSSRLRSSVSAIRATTLVIARLVWYTRSRRGSGQLGGER